jgi:hypothetical protein
MQLLVGSIVRDVTQMPAGRFERSDLKNVRRLWQSLAESNQGVSMSRRTRDQHNIYLPCLYHPEKCTNGIQTGHYMRPARPRICDSDHWPGEGQKLVE